MSEPKTPNDSPALLTRTKNYPEWLKGVPKAVRMLTTVRPDSLIFEVEPRARPIVALAGKTYPCWVNSHGAVAVILGPDMLGVKPDEFEPVEWH